MPDQEATTKKTVVISPHAFGCMVAYAAQYPTSSVHGIVVGSSDASKIQVSNVYPICHDETPTKPLIDIALAMVGSSLEDDSDDKKKNIIGWFTAPELLEDNTAGPVPLRIVSTMEGDDADKVLLVIRNQEVTEIIFDTDMLNGPEGKAAKAIEAYGKDFGGQWMEPLDVEVINEGDAETLAKKGKATVITDLVDHWKAVPTTGWTHAEQFSS